MSSLKDALYDQVKRDSQNARHIGEDLNWDFLAAEGKKNEKNPGRAIGKAATAALTWYLGGPAWGAAGNAANSAVPPMAEMGGQTAMNAANAMQPAMAGLGSSMESALQDTGYTPSSLMNAFRYGPDSGQGMGQTMSNFASNKGMGLMHQAQNNPMGLLGNDNVKRYAMRQGMDMMQPQQYQSPPPPPPRQQQPLLTPYLSEEDKRRLMMQGIY